MNPRTGCNFASWPLLLLILIFTSCSNDPKQTPEAVIKRYEILVRGMKADSISQLFTQDAETGELGQPPVKGRDSIYRFLSSFTDVRVLSNRDSISGVTIHNDSAFVNGIFKQWVILPGGDSVHASGRFMAILILTNDKNWLIGKMQTQSE